MTKDEFWRKKKLAIKLASQLSQLLVKIGVDRHALTVGHIQNYLQKYSYIGFEKVKNGSSQ